QAAVAVQTALNKGKPIDALVEDLAEKVSGIPIVQDAVQHLGSKVGHRIDRALGGAIGRIEGAIENVQAEIGGAIDVVDELDGNVAQYDETDWDVVSYIEESGVINGLVPVDRANAAQDVAASAYSRAAELNGGLEPGISRDTMRGRIKNGLLDQSLERIGGYLGENGAGKVFCTAAGRGEYELASKQLGQTPLVPNDPDTARYICCYDIQTQTPVSARLLGSDEEETAADETAEETTTQSEDAAIVGQGEQIPVGNYTGVSNYPEVLNKMGWFVESEGNLTYHNVTVNVADDGNVSGSYSLYYVGFQQDKFNYFGKVCSGHAEADITGVFEGQLTGSRGIIRSTENWVCPQFYDCQILDVCTTDEPYYREFEIQINGGTMTGVTVPYPEDQDHIFVWTFNAVRE
ncbi:MAG: hypothetical protein JXA42_04525, partial [Anaerolineales bacterium]|nr:hypothetical protein [Anaerolineales bacterium]